eukprot:scaffold2274_cov343-Pavlova_lutheri.AAC.9
MEEFVNLEQFEEKAREVLPTMVYDYFASGSDTETTLRWNRESFQRYMLRPRILKSVEQVDTSIDVFGTRVGSPVLIAPSAMQKMAHPIGEIGMVKAASTQGNALILSTMATTSLEDVADHSRTVLLFQLYVLKDRNYVRRMVQRAECAGYKGVVVTVDAPVLGNRERDKINRFTLPGGLRLEHLVEFSPEEGSMPTNQSGSALVTLFQESLDQTLTWNFIEELRTMTSLPIIVKGVLTGDDAEEALAAGVDAIIVSNHGGRQLDYAPAALDVLPEIASAVQGRVPIWVDGGIRRGTDVLKCIALGASAVLLGRPVLYGLAVGGQAGVERVLELLHEEIKTGMALLGARSIAEISEAHIRRHQF